LNLYIPKNNNNLLLLDSPGDTEIRDKLALFALHGYEYSKMIFYIISEETVLDLDNMEKNDNLKYILHLKIKYKLPLIILLTHSDDYCHKVKATEPNKWKNICKTQLRNNKKNLLDWLNNTIKDKYNSEYKVKENDIKHTVLVEKKEKEEMVELTDEDVVKNLDEDTKKDYENANDNEKQLIIKIFKKGYKSGEKGDRKEIDEFIKGEIGVFRKNELIEEIKKYLPSQYHSALIKY
jgi:hypothetical protein